MQTPSKIDPDEYELWLRHPVTEALRERLRSDRERLKEEWASGSFQKDPVLDAHARGQCVILQQILDLDHQEIAEKE